MSHDMNNMVILVDEQDTPCGTMEKMAAHKQGLCHRAFSVNVFRKQHERIELLIQRRELNKYHCGGLWTNTCCSHPKPAEDTLSAAIRRLTEELNLQVPLQEIGCFHYIARFENGLTENEVDHVFLGEYQEQPIVMNKAEVMEIKWVELHALYEDVIQDPTSYTPWFARVLDIVKSHFNPSF